MIGIRTVVAAGTFALVLAGCSGSNPIFKDQALDRAFTSGTLHIGSSIGDVSKVVGRGPSTIGDDYSTSTTSTGTRTLWRPGSRGENWSKTYTLIFENGKLVQYSK